MPQYKVGEDFDFGFSFEDDQFGAMRDAVEQAETHAALITDERWTWKWRALELRKAIGVLLVNLEKNASQELIRWPNRAQAVESFREKLDEILKAQPPFDEDDE